MRSRTLTLVLMAYLSAACGPASQADLIMSEMKMNDRLSSATYSGRLCSPEPRPLIREVLTAKGYTVRTEGVHLIGNDTTVFRDSYRGTEVQYIKAIAVRMDGDYFTIATWKDAITEGEISRRNPADVSGDARDLADRLRFTCFQELRANGER